MGDAPDLEKGVTKVLEMVQFDRKQELARLIKKADDFKRRSQRGVKLDGDDEELRDMQIAAQDLEKKVGAGVLHVDGRGGDGADQGGHRQDRGVQGDQRAAE